MSPTDDTYLPAISGGHSGDISQGPPSYVLLPWGANWVTGDVEIDVDHIVLNPKSIKSIDLYDRDRGDSRLIISLASVETPDHARARPQRRPAQ